MRRTVEWDRRRFLQLMGGASTLGFAGSQFGWSASQAVPARKANYAYIGAEHEIHVYSLVAGERFIRQQTIVSANPVAMAISGGNLYVSNGVSKFGNLPCGSVEAYGIDASTGRLELKNRVALSLSGILPRDLAISPDGRSLVVAVHGGGAYNVLPFQADGRLGRVSGILKEVGSGPHATQAGAHPSAVIFDRFGRLLAADQGTDKLSVILLCNGELRVADRYKVIAGSGPGSIALDHNGKRLFVAHALTGLISSLDYDETSGKILDCTHTVQASAVGEMAMLAMHPSGEMLYSSRGDGMDVWKIAANGSLEALTGMGGFQVNRLSVTADGRSLLALSSDGVLSMQIHPATHLPAVPVKMATLSNPVSIAIL